jgi:hypothetical protein
MLTDSLHLVLFWVFIGFFVVIGVIALMAIAGVIKVDKEFRKWAIGGFVTGVAGVVFVWGKSQEPLDFFVNLKSPDGINAETFELVSGKYEYSDASASADSTQPSGSVELAVGQEIGSWTAKFPQKGANKAVKLTLTDNDGNLWAVRPFYPNHIHQPLMPTQKIGLTNPLPSILVKSAFAVESKIHFNNYAKVERTLNNRTYYKWRVFVDEPVAVLNKIAEVQYLLHPTFPEPLQVRTSPEDKFAVEATGWGGFYIQITIQYKDRSIVKTNYHLDLSKGWP